MFKKFLPWYLLGLVVLSLAFIYGCGAAPTSGGGSAASSVTYYGTSSPGDSWRWDIGSDGTFSGSNETTGFRVSGTYVTLPSRFGKAHVTSINGTATSEYAYFLEFPNTMLLVKPGGGNDNVIVCAAAASTAPLEGQYNWVTIPWQGWNYTQDNAYGTVEVSVTGDSYTLGVKFYKLNGQAASPAGTTESGYGFVDGRLVKAGSDLKIFMTPSGFFGADMGSNGGFAGASALSTFTSFEVAGKNFRGVLFEYDSATGTGETKPIGATGEANGVIHGADFDDIDNDTDPNYLNKGATLEFNAITNGVGSGTLTSGTGSYAFTLVVGKVGIPEKIMIFGISTQESGPYNFLVIEK